MNSDDRGGAAGGPEDPSACDVLILGASMAGIDVLYQLRRRGGAGRRLKVIVVDRQPAHGYIPLVQERLCARIDRGSSELETRSIIDGDPNAPRDWNNMFPGTGGALYGGATHGWTASFKRPPMRTKLPGLYLVGGSAHPGAGLPMVTLGGALVARQITEDLASTARSRRAVTSGGMSTGSATTASTPSA